MGSSTQDVRHRILDAAYQCFYSKGFNRSGIDEIAREAGVTKKTLYYHFDSKDTLLAEVLKLQNQPALQRIQRWSEEGNQTAVLWIEALFADLARWMAQPGWSGAGFTRLAMELADLPGHPARKAASVHKSAVEGWIESYLLRQGIKDHRQCAREIMLLIEGAMALTLIHRDIRYVQVAGHAARRLLAERQ